MKLEINHIEESPGFIFDSEFLGHSKLEVREVGNVITFAIISSIGTHRMKVNAEGIVTFEFKNKDGTLGLMKDNDGKVKWLKGMAFKSLGRKLVAVNIGPLVRKEETNG